VKNIIEKRRRKETARTKGSRERNMRTVDRKKERKHVAIVSPPMYKGKGTHKQSKKIKS